MIVSALAWSLLHSLWQLTGIGAVVALLLHAQRRERAQVRYATAVVGYGLMGWAPLATFAWLVNGAPDPVTGAVVTATAAGPWPMWLVGAWVVGVTLFGARALTDLVRIETLSRTGIVAPPALAATFDRLRRELGAPAVARLRLVSRQMSPVAVGFLRPAVLLPATLLTRLSPQEMEAVLAHELVHLKRLDYAVNLLQTVFDAALYYHPAARWLSTTVREEREHACDAEVVASLGNRLAYARALMELEAWRVQVRSVVPAATGGALRQRVLRILGRQTDQVRPRWALPGLVAASLVALGTGAVAIAQEEPAASESYEHEHSTVLEPDGRHILFDHGDVRVLRLDGSWTGELPELSGSEDLDEPHELEAVAELQGLTAISGLQALEGLTGLAALGSLEGLGALNGLSGLERLAELEGLADLSELEGLFALEELGSVVIISDGEVQVDGEDSVVLRQDGDGDVIVQLGVRHSEPRPAELRDRERRLERAEARLERAERELERAARELERAESRIERSR